MSPRTSTEVVRADAVDRQLRTISVAGSPAAAPVCTLLDALPVAACMLNAQGKIVSCNDAWRALMALHPLLQEFTRHDAEFLTACRRAESIEGIRALGARIQRMLAQDANRAPRQLNCDFAAGQQWISARIAPLSCGTGCVILCEDVTEQRTVERDLRRLQAAEALQRQSAVQYALLAQFGQFALENPAFSDLAARAVQVVQRGLGSDYCRLLMMEQDEHTLSHVAGSGWDPAAVQGARFDVVTETEDRFILGARESIVVRDYQQERRFRASPLQVSHDVRSAAEVLICGGGGIYGIIGAYMREPDRFNEDSAAFLQNLANTISAFMERKLVEDRLSRMAQFDALTGLPNRTTYLDRLAHTLEEAGRDQRPVAVLFVDVDRFKAVNDTLGHAVGDALLVAIAKRLKDAVRSGDTIGRLSGDEFALVLAHLAREDHAGLVAQKITRALSTPFEIEGHTVYVSGSVGISLSPCDGTDPEVLLKNADLAMYRAKQSGRNGYQFYLPQMQERAVGRLRLETRLRDALERDEYVLHYQPKLDLRTGRVSGLEALLRWQSDDVLVSPTEFIGVLEDTGLIIPVGERVVSKVCAQIRAWQDAGIAPLPVAVNISARQFHQDRLDAVLARLLGESGVDPRLLELELTESLLMSDAEAAISTLRRIKDRGLLLALDDFGTGYSSLSYLKRFPLDAVKIDRAFIRDVMEDPSDASIVTAIVNLARNLELKVIAEGVETPQQMSFLRQRGCDEVQGHYIAPPMPAAQITQMLAGGQQWSLAATMSAMDADL